MLTKLGVEFEVVVSGVEELTDGDPERLVIENARRKALAVTLRPSSSPVTRTWSSTARSFGKPA